MKSPMHFKPSIPGALLRILGVAVVAALLIGAAIQLRPAGGAQALPAPKNCAAVASGEWNNSANWDCAGAPGEVPGVDDTVVIDGQSIQVSADQAVKDLKVLPSASLAIADAVTLTVGGTLDVSEASALQAVVSDDDGNTYGGSVVFGPDGDQTLATNGAWLSFWNLSKSGSGTLNVNSCTADLTSCTGGFEVYNQLALKGTGTETVRLRSSIEGVAFTFSTHNAADIDGVDVKDAINQGDPIRINTGRNSGNNVGWKFTGLSTSSNPSLAEQDITLTMVLPVGVVQDSLTFMDGLLPIACNGVAGAVAVVDGVASCSTAELGVGNHTITVRYEGGQVAQVEQVVNLSTVLVLTVNSPQSLAGQEVAFVANLMPMQVAGQVTFKDGDTPICVGAQVNTESGQAICQAVLSEIGEHSITAEFIPNQGDTLSSTSSPLLHAVKNLGSVSLTSSSASVNRFQTLTLTAQVASAGEASGVVDFMADGNYIDGCTQVAVVDKQASCQVSGLGAGRHSLTAFYSGDATNFGVTSSVVDQVVNTLIFMPQLWK